jgi:hypothetical protein
MKVKHACETLARQQESAGQAILRAEDRLQQDLVHCGIRAEVLLSMSK